MKVYLNKIDGIADSIISMYLSKRTWTREKELYIRNLCNKVLDENGFINHNIDTEQIREFKELFSTVLRWGQKHITMLRFIDFSITVEGLHRGAQDDFDSHAKRFENRIIRSSTRLATFKDELSDWYKEKIIPTDEALAILGVECPNIIEHNNFRYVKTNNGYIKEDLQDDKDVKRGLYMLSIPSNFICKINLTELSHVVKERDRNSNAHPELQEMIESLISQIENEHCEINRDLYYNIKN